MSDAVALIIKHQVKSEFVLSYEQWLKDIAHEGKRYPGHMGVNIVRPHGASLTYTIVLRFDSHARLQAWMDSDVRQKLIQQAATYLAAEEELEMETGLEYWFTPPRVATPHAKPFKQFLLTTSAIYPLTLIVPWLLSPLLEAQWLSQWPALQGLVVVLVIVYLMVYTIMPRYTRLVSGWLFR